MKKIIFLFAFISSAIFIRAQNSNPYFPADSTKDFIYTGNNPEILWEGFQYIGRYSKTSTDSLRYLRTITYVSGEPRKDTMVYIVTANSAFFVCMLQNGGTCSDVEKRKLFEIPPKNDSIVNKVHEASDMSSYDFIITIKWVPSCEVNGEIYKDVIETQLYNPKEKYYWNNYYAKGIGLIEDGDGNYLVKVAK
jgi:hypothetical protein